MTVRLVQNHSQHELGANAHFVNLVQPAKVGGCIGFDKIHLRSASTGVAEGDDDDER